MTPDLSSNDAVGFQLSQPGTKRPRIDAGYSTQVVKATVAGKHGMEYVKRPAPVKDFQRSGHGAKVILYSLDGFLQVFDADLIHNSSTLYTHRRAVCFPEPNQALSR